MRVRAVIGSAAATLTLSALLAGCGGTDAAAPPGAAPAAPTPAPSRSTSAGTAPGPIAASMFRADLTIQHDGLGLLALTDTTRHAVIVRGWPTLAFLNAANDTVAVPLREVAVPGAGPTITIGPGETAFAGVRWTVGDRADPTTFVATTLRLTPPGGTGWITVHVVGPDGTEVGHPEFALTSADIGTLQPSSQGVLVFSSRVRRAPTWRSTMSA
jgi:hypothetical protein